MASASTDLVSLTDVKSYLGISGEDDDTLLNALIDRVSQAIETCTGRVFGYETITKELHNGNGLTRLRLLRYPVDYVVRLSIGRVNAMDIVNAVAESGASHAYVSVGPTSLVLLLVGGDNAGTDIFTLSSYVTVSALVDAVNAIGHGWSAALDDVDAAAYPAGDLIPTTARYHCLDATVGLDCPREPEIDYRMDDADAGIIYCSGGFTEGVRNVVVDYIAGYDAPPDDIVHAACLWVASLYNRAKEGADGLASESIPQLTQRYLHECPPEARDTIAAYRELLI